MFERTELEIKSGVISIYVTQKEAQCVGEFAVIHTGKNELTFESTLELQRLCSKFITTASKRQRPVIRTLHNSLSVAWGHEVGLPFITS